MESRLAVITFFEPGEHPVYPDNTLPSGGFNRPDNSLPGGGTTLPVFPFDPTVPSNELPEVPVVWPPRPNQRFVVKYLACKGLILVPDNSLPPHAQPK